MIVRRREEGQSGGESDVWEQALVMMTLFWK